ncbi:MAG: hypothetical protein DRJ62_03460 [Thermoprotei archaeon]|nr:MAG: hypothetical protein DRJ62_03460 [Thermoprotei archaeon]
MEENNERMRKVREYENAKRAYYEDALKFMGEGDFRKASELLWGAITIQVKLLALIKKGLHLGNHKQIRLFVQGVAKELQDEEIFKSFEFLERLHVNFYDEIIEPNVFMFYAKEAAKFLKRLEDIMRMNT